MLNFIHAPYHYLALITYVASASTGSEEGDEPFCPQTDSTDWRKADELIRMGWNRTSTAPPVYLLAADIEPEWRETADEVMRSAWEILGYYGPFHYLAVGTDTKAAEAVMYRFCELLNLPCEKCLSSENVEHIWKLVKTHPGDAFASTPTTPPVKIIVQSVNKREWEKRKIAIHEYVHIYQNSLVLNRQQTSPVWVKEGSAEFFAMYLSGEKGWHDFTAFMKTEMEVLQEMRKTHPDLRLADIETWEALKQIQEKRPKAAYTLLSRAALWGVAYMAHVSSMHDVYRGYHKDLYKLGWKASFERHIGLEPSRFYRQFEAFLERPLEAQMHILPCGELKRLVGKIED